MEKLAIGPAPVDEPCEQLGPHYDAVKAMRECREFIALIRRVLGAEPPGARLMVRSAAHDFGRYYEVYIEFDERDDDATAYAFIVEARAPTRWGATEASHHAAENTLAIQGLVSAIAGIDHARAAWRLAPEDEDARAALLVARDRAKAARADLAKVVHEAARAYRFECDRVLDYTPPIYIDRPGLGLEPARTARDLLAEAERALRDYDYATTHVLECRQLASAAASKRAAWLTQWPHACERCHGGGQGIRVAGEREVCACVAARQCPRCMAAEALDEDRNGPCRACGWNYNDHAPPPPDTACGCADELAAEEEVRRA